MLKKEEAFTSKWLIIPAFYRDIDFSDSSSRVTQDPVNEMYVKLLSLAASSDVNTGFDFMGALTESRIQLLLVEIYVMLTQKLAKKNGYIHQYLMGKRVDYAVRSVISAPGINSNKWTDQRVPFIYTGVPLAMICNLFYPFMVKEIQDFFERELSTQNYIEYLAKGEDVPKKAYLKNPMEDFNAEGVKKLISIFIKSHENRFMPIKVNTEEGKISISMYFNKVPRTFTLTDLLYICAEEVIKDKHVYVTRYPITEHQRIFGTRIKVLSTHDTTVCEIKGKEYPYYPLVTPKEEPVGKSSFFDSVQPNNSYLEAIGGDYDGDMVSLLSVYTQEANDECEKNIFSTKNILNANGRNIRKLSKEAVLTMYCLTKD
jgi:DNA-directed RNA polymerase beta' subunit